MTVETITTIFSQSRHFQIFFCVINITGDIKNFVQILIFLNTSKYIMEMPGIGVFCNYSLSEISNFHLTLTQFVGAPASNSPKQNHSSNSVKFDVGAPTNFAR